MEELWLILNQFAAENIYEISSNVKSYLLPFFIRDMSIEGESFGNARYIRNIFDSTLQIQASRLMSQSLKPSKSDLVELHLEAFKKVFF